MGTTLSDVIVPEIFTPYTIKRTMELSALVQSGIVVNSPDLTNWQAKQHLSTICHSSPI